MVIHLKLRYGAEAIQTLLKQVDLDAEFELVSKEEKKLKDKNVLNY